PLGAMIAFLYQGLTEAGVPRFPTFAGVRQDAGMTLFPSAEKGAVPMSASPKAARRFEFSEGNSNKFWAVSVSGTEVPVGYGRIGTQGQALVKSFPDEQAAHKHADGLMREKTGKGYREVA